MHVKRLTPILNVSDIQQSFAWFDELFLAHLRNWEQAVSAAAKQLAATCFFTIST